MEDLTALLMQYEARYKRAIKAYENKAYDTAKEEYLKAAEIMYKAAQKSTSELKKVRLEKAKKLILIADQIEKKQHHDVNTSITHEDYKGDSALKVKQIPDITFNDIVGLDEVKKTIYTQMILPIKHPDKYGAYRKRTGGGVLLFGPPGTGKTTIAKAIANEVGASFYLVKGSDILNKYVGESEKNIANLFNAARSEELAIIFIDDMDSLFMKRGQDIHNDERVNEFLQHIDGFSGQATNVLLLGATNRPWSIDTAIKRPGRFSRHIYIPLPDEEARFFMFKKFLEDVPLSEDVDFSELVELTEYYSGADIFEVCEQAKVEPLMKSIQTDKIIEISQKDFIHALNTVGPSVDKFELKKFNEYTNAKSPLVKTPEAKPIEEINEPETEEPYQDQPTITITHHDDTLSLPIHQKPVLRFALSEDIDSISILIDTKRYVCFKEMNQFRSDRLDIDVPGEYQVDVYHKDTLLTHFIVTFTKGIKEEDMGL